MKVRYAAVLVCMLPILVSAKDAGRTIDALTPPTAEAASIVRLLTEEDAYSAAVDLFEATASCVKEMGSLLNTSSLGETTDARATEYLMQV